jgi:hypothetical protein
MVLIKKSPNPALNVLLNSVRPAEVKASPLEKTHAPHLGLPTAPVAVSASADVQVGTLNGYSFPFVPSARFVTEGPIVVVTSLPFVSMVSSNIVAAFPSILTLTLTVAFVSVISHDCEFIGENMTIRQKAMLAHGAYFNNSLTGKMQAGRWSVVVQRLNFGVNICSGRTPKRGAFEIDKHDSRTFSLFAIIRSDHVEYQYRSVEQSFTTALI